MRPSVTKEAIKAKIAAIKEQQTEGNAAISAYGEAVRAAAAEGPQAAQLPKDGAASARTLSADQVEAIRSTDGLTDATIKLTATQRKRRSPPERSQKSRRRCGQGQRLTGRRGEQTRGRTCVRR